MTFQHPRVQEHIHENFVLTAKEVDPGYMGPAFDPARIKRLFGPDADPNMGETEFSKRLLEKIPTGTANNDVAVAFATGDGQLVHVLAGLWSGEDCAREMDYAHDLSRKIKGLPREEQHRVISQTHRERLAGFDEESHQGLGREALKNALEETAKNPDRNLVEVPEQDLWDSPARQVGFPYRSLKDMGWMKAYIVSHTDNQARKAGTFFDTLKKRLNPKLIRLKRDVRRHRRAANLPIEL